ncbi:MAG: carbohydrate kinase family protein [Candidatus Nealsonbacteria bacterium]
MKYDVITFGSAAADNYLILKDEQKYIVSDKKVLGGQALHFPLGLKTEIKSMEMFSGGGGTNSAATFCKQGLKTAYLGKIGRDRFGEAVIDNLKKCKIDTKFVKRDLKLSTARSLVISLSTGERNIFIYRGASDFLNKKDIPWSKIKSAKWFYLAPFSGASAELTAPIVDFAHKNKIKVALNPGYTQLKFDPNDMKNILNKVDVLLLNQEEAALLTKIPYQKESLIFQKLDSLVKGITIMSKGSDGAVASDGEYLYHTPGTDSNIVDKTGAGDSFGSGFVSGLLQDKGIVGALQLATANATACLTQKGAKKGLLNKGDTYTKVEIIKKKCYEETDLCQVKFERA